MHQEFVLVRSFALALFVVLGGFGCGGGGAGGAEPASEAPVAEAPATSSGEESAVEEAGTLAQLRGGEHLLAEAAYREGAHRAPDLEGCLFRSRDATEVACLEHFYDMGAVSSTLFIHAVEDGRELRRFVYFEGESGLPEGLHAEVLEQLNAYLRERAFLDEREGASAPLPEASFEREGGQVTVTYEGSSAQVQAPPPVAAGTYASEAPDPGQCCRWEVESGRAFPAGGLAAVAFRNGCRWTSDPDRGSDPCYWEGYTEEGAYWPRALRVGRLRASE